MFGSKKRANKEELAKLQRCKEFVEEFVDKKEELQGDYSELEESKNRMQKDLELLSEHIQSVSGYVSDNADTVSNVCGHIEEYQRRIEDESNQYSKLKEQIAYHARSCVDLVEKNKHFTTPSKQLSDITDELRKQNKEFVEMLDGMEDFARQMGVLSLNAAIEAGRLGDAGRQFVLASEEVRSFSAQYAQSANLLKEEIKESENTIAKMEEMIHHLVGLLKENNISTTKIMRSAQDMQVYADETILCGGNEDIAAVREDLIGVFNNQEEVIKIAERNRMHLEDIQEETRNQTKNEQELVELVMSLIEQAQNI